MAREGVGAEGQVVPFKCFAHTTAGGVGASDECGAARVWVEEQMPGRQCELFVLVHSSLPIADSQA